MTLRRLLKKLWDQRYIVYSIYFNFHYLPFKQALKLPIILYKPKLYRCKGKVIIAPKDGVIRPGMIKLGFNNVSVYPNSGIVWENLGGTIIFRGKCRIGNDTYLSFGEKTTVDFGDDFRNAAGAKIISYRGIKFGQIPVWAGVFCAWILTSILFLI